MKKILISSETILMSKRKQNVKLAIYFFLVLSQWECSSAEPESVNGLLADNVNHQKISENQPLKTQKKQMYPLKDRTTENGKDGFKQNTLPQNTKVQQKARIFKAQKHQKLLNAIEENYFPRINNSPNSNKPPQSAIRNILAQNNNRINNEVASDKAARNINFLNERARPPQNPRATGTVNLMNENEIASNEKPKGYPNLHPATIGRISYKGNNDQASKPFGKFLQSYPKLRQSQGRDFPSRFPTNFPRLTPYQGKETENYVNPKGFPQPRYNIPNEAYIENTNGDQKQRVPQYWNGKLNSMKNAASLKMETHKWPIQPNPNGVPANPLNDKNDKYAKNNILRNLANNVREEGSFGKQIPETKVHQKLINAVPNNNKQTKSDDEDTISSSTSNLTGQNLNQVPENIQTEKNKVVIQQPASSTSSPDIMSSSNTDTVKIFHTEPPKLEMLKADKKAFDFGYDSPDIPRDSFSALIIGLTFVVIFIVIAVGLVGHSIYTKMNNYGDRDGKNNQFGRSTRGRFMRSPNEEDRTPPELRTGCGQPSFVQPELGNSINGGYCGSRNGVPNGTNMDQNGTNQPFFNGKLILHELNSNTSKYPGMNGIGSQMSQPIQTNSKYLGLGKPGEHLGAIPKKMPSPAANVQITDDLISPKYDEKDDHRHDSTESEEEDSSDDTVYECPGLAASSGDDIVVANPFFMPGQNFTPLVPTQNSPARKTPKPISKNETLFHQGITGFN